MWKYVRARRYFVAIEHNLSRVAGTFFNLKTKMTIEHDNFCSMRMQWSNALHVHEESSSDSLALVLSQNKLKGNTILLLIKYPPRQNKPLSVLQNNATFRFSLLVYMVCRHWAMLSGTNVEWCLANKNVFFFSVMATLLLAVCFCFRNQSSAYRS